MDASGVVEHVHNLALDLNTLYLGTHEGLFRQAPGQALTRVSNEPFDVMGLTQSGETWFASGHPAAGSDGPPDLGLIASQDRGETWSPIALSGTVDFHRLTISGKTLLGVSAHDGTLMRSTDFGKTWTTISSTPPFDVALDPLDPSVVVATTPDGPTASNDAGDTFSPIAGAPLIALLAWDGGDLYGVDPGGQVLVSRDSGQTWTPRGSVGAEPIALAAQDGRLAVLAGGTIYFSTDAGQTFTPRITGLAGH